MKELYNSLYNQGLYTGTFEQFQSDYGGENYQELYNKLNDNDYYTGSFDQFNTDYDPNIAEKEETITAEVDDKTKDGISEIKINGNITTRNSAANTINAVENIEDFNKLNIEINNDNEISNLYTQKQKDLEQKDINVFKSFGAYAGSGISKFFEGLGETQDALIYGAATLFNPDMDKEEKLLLKDSIKKGYITPSYSARIPTQELENATKFFDNYKRKTESKNILDAVDKGNYLEAAELTVGGALESIPSIALVFGGGGGLSLLATSVSGNKFAEEFENNPDESLGTLYANAAGTGIVESSFELVTRGLLKQAGIIGGIKGKDVAQQFLKDGAKDLVKKVGWFAGATGAEGLSEASTELATMYIDAYGIPIAGGLGSIGSLNRKSDFTVDFSEGKYGEGIVRLFDSFMIGSFVGGNFQSVAAVGDTRSAARNRAETLLTPASIKKIYADGATQLSEIYKNLDNPNISVQAKKILKQKAEQIEQDIARVKKETSKALNNLTKDELIENFKYVEQIQENVEAYNSLPDKRKSTGRILRKNIQEAQQAQQDLFEQAAQRELQKSIEFARTQSEEVTGRKTKIIETFEKVRTEYGDEAAAADAFFDPSTGDIVINKEIASKTKAVSVGSHELLHGILQQLSLSDPSIITGEGGFLETLNDNQRQALEKRIKDNGYTKKYLKANPDEYLTQFSDAINENEIVFEENLFTKIGNIFTPLLRRLGFNKIKFNTGKDVYDFMKEYNKSIKQGKLTGAIKEVLPDKTKTKKGGLKFSRSADIDALVGPKTDGQYTLTKAEYLRKADETLSKVFPKLQGLIESKIPIDRPPGFSQEDFVSGTVEELIPHIRNFNPEQNNSLSGWINSQLQNKIGNVFKKGEAATKEVFEDDVTEAKGVTEVQETVEEVTPETQTASKLRKIVGVERKRGLEIARNIVKGKLPDLNDKKLRSQINRQARDEYLTEIRDLLNDLTDNQKLEIVKTLPVQDLVKLERLQKDKIFAKIVANNINPTQVDKAIKEGKLPKGTNRLSGPKLYERLDVTAEQVADFFTSKKRNAFAGVIAENLVKDALPEVTAEPESKQRRARAEEAQGRKVVEKDREQLLEKVERDPGLKFSKSFKGAPEYVIELGKKLNTRLTKNAIDKALVDINNELTDELFDVYNKKYFQPYIKARKAADKMAWPNAEETVLKNIKILENKIPGIKITQVELNKDAQKVDIEFILNGDKVFIEVKKNDQARLSQVYLHRNKKNKVYATENRADKKYIDRIIKEDSNNRNVLIDFIKEKYSNEIFEEKRGDKINIVVTPGAYYGAKRQLAKQNRAVEKRLKLPIDFVSDVYNRKNTYYIDFGDIGTFYMNKNPQNFPVASLLQKNKDGKLIDVEVRTQWKPSKPRANGNFTISRIAVPTLTNEAKKVLSDTQTFSMQDEQQAEKVLNVSGNKILASKLNNSILPPVDKFKGDFNNTEVLDKMAEVDNASVKEERKLSKSANLSKGFNEILEKKTGIAADKTYSKVKAQVVGANKGRFNFFIPPSAEDFVGLLYKTLSKNKLGDSQMAWYKAHLLNPFARAMDNLTRDRVALMNDFKALKKELKVVPKTLKKKIPGEGFTQEQAVRVYIWDQQAMDIPGMEESDVKELVDFVNSKKDLKLFADQLIALQKGDLYAAPRDGWNAGTITTDLIEGINTTKRAKYLEVWQQNVDEIFSQENLNKLEAIYGKGYRGALENILKRMQTGRNRTFPGDSLTGRFTDWLSNSIGAIMFFNMRSAVLQTISTVNFINFRDNNILAASKAFANQPQFWADFKKLFNSDFLLDRRAGLKLNVQEADIAELAKKGGVRGVISELLRLGFLPTQLADSFAISSGGATFYRNRIKTLEKQGLTPKEAEKQAFQDFREVAEESQQSSRPDRISQQQAGPLGRIILAFQNTPMQYARLIKKAASDLKNGRGDAKTNISKILYYGFVQNLIFNTLQQAAFALGFGDTEEEEEKREKKYNSILNSMADSIIRGTGVAGVVFATIKNTLIKLEKESKKKSPKYQDAVLELAQVSPPLGSKIRKIQSAGRSYSWNKKEMLEKGWSIDNPAYLAAGQVIAATTNIPLDRAFKKIDNIRNSSRSDLEAWQRIALIAGWSDWDLGIKDVKTKSTKTKKTRRVIKKKSKKKKF